MPQPPERSSAEITLRVARSDVAAARNTAARLQQRLISLLRQGLGSLDRSVLALDFACGDGQATLGLFQSLPPGSRVVALSEDRARLARFHERLESSSCANIYPRKETRHRLPFVPASFDLAWASLASEPVLPLQPVLRQVLRALKPGAQLLVAAVLRQSFLDLAPLLAERLDPAAPRELLQRLFAAPEHVLDLADWEPALGRSGASTVELQPTTASFTLHPPLSNDALLATLLVPMWLADDPLAQSTLLEGLGRVDAPKLELTAHLVLVRARRGHMEIEDTSST